MKETRQARKRYGSDLHLSDVARFYFIWNRCVLRGTENTLIEDRPWITFPAIRFLEQLLTKDMRVFEYGAGASTIFFAKRVKEVISMDHDPEWAAKVNNVLRERGCSNAVVKLIEPSRQLALRESDPSDPDMYLSTDERFAGCSFKTYALFIDRFPDRYFDLVLIDGRARPSCFKHAGPKVKKGGYIVWDNTDHTEYHRAMANAPATWRFQDFPGPTPYAGFFTRTSAWQIV